MLAVLPAMTALAGSGLRLKPWEAITDDGDFDTAALRYKCTERYSEGFTDWRGVFGNDSIYIDTPLSEKSLEDMLKQMRDFTEHPPEWALKPTKLIVDPKHYELATRILTERPPLWQRLWWRLTPRW
jgi:hypothetical protein